MKKNLLRASAFAFALSICATLPSCGGDQAQKEADKPAAKAAAQAGQLPNYRYVDLDTVLSKYNLAKDYNEEILRMQTNMESEVKRHENSIQSFASSMQKKLQNNGYLSEESYKADQDKINNMQANAQRSVASLQSNFENAAMNAQKTVNDSVQAFIKEYNAKKKYDAIFFKAATLFISPELDITAEVVEGLNARYNKVKK
ncbi:MAG: OmpH family outer membrane protein [Muribaculaceae bacterium]|jgi:Outer membrane protein